MASWLEPAELVLSRNAAESNVRWNSRLSRCGSSLAVARRGVINLWIKLFRPFADAMPPIFEPFQIPARIRHPVSQGLAAEGFVGPQMQVLRDAQFHGPVG